MENLFKNTGDKKEAYKQVTDELYDLYVAKNKEYGDSIGEMYDEDGLAPCLYQMKHKISRAITIANKDDVQFESLEDTLRDLANYAVISYMEYKLHSQPSTNDDDIAELLGITIDELKDRLRTVYNRFERLDVGFDEYCDIHRRREVAENANTYTELVLILYKELSDVIQKVTDPKEINDMIAAMTELSFVYAILSNMEGEV